MKKLNKNPLVWFILVLISGYIIVGDSSSFEGMIILILAIVIAKQIETINLIEEKN